MVEMEELASDAVRAAWWANKRTIGGGACAYICAYVHSNGRRCRRIVELQDPGRHRRYAAAAEWVAAAGWGTRRGMGGEHPWRYCWRHRMRGPSGLRNQAGE